MQDDILSVALRARNRGISVVPIKDDGSKRPDGFWRAYQSQLPTVQDIENWFGPYKGIGFLTGTGEVPLECIEFEGRAVDEGILRRFLDDADRLEMANLIERLQHGYVERSPSGGIHWLYFCPVAEGNRKLASRPATAEELAAGPHERVKGLIETRGVGGMIIVAPSNGSTHETGKPWELIAGSVDTIPAITPEEREALLALARSYDVEVDRPSQPRPRPARTTTADPDRLSPGEWYNLNTSWEELLEPEGWTFLFETNGVQYLRRPGKHLGQSATINANGTDQLKSFTTSTEIPTEGTHSKFGVYAFLHHGGDFSAAAATVRKTMMPKPEPITTASTTTTTFTGIGATDLFEMDLAETAHIVDKVIYPGVTLLIADPKQGKSVLVLDLAVSIALNRPALGHLDTDGGQVLYLALEDNRKRLRDRIEAITTPEERRKLTGLTLVTSEDKAFPRIGEGAEEAFESWLRANGNPKLIIVDVMQKIQPPEDNRSGGTAYQRDYKWLAKIVPIAHRNNIGLILVHHTTKGDGGGDVWARISGSNGIRGSVDTTLYLEANFEEAKGKLVIQGRDITETSYQLGWAGNRWLFVVQRNSPEEQSVFDIIQRFGPIDVDGLAAELQIAPTAAKQRLIRMTHRGKLTKVSDGWGATRWSIGGSALNPM